MSARRLGVVPVPVAALFALALLAQLGWHGLRPDPLAVASPLPAAPSLDSLRLAALGDPIVLARVLMLWLQAHDNQPGVSIPFRNLDYTRLTRWLGRILDLDPRGQYPLLAASRVYGTVPDQERRRIALDFVSERFPEDPNRRWPWLAHAAIIAKHRMGDLPRALRYARAITDLATGPGVPAWARDMSAVVLEDMGELEAARILIGGLIHSGRVTDPHELRFLERKLEELEEAERNKAGTASAARTGRDVENSTDRRFSDEKTGDQRIE